MAISEEKFILEKKVKDQLSWDDRIPSSDITIEVMGDIVRLSGEVPTYSSRLAAEEDALSVMGVHRVENDLQIKYPESIRIPNDIEIKKILKDTLRNDHRINANEIKINIINGVVRLEGTIDAFWKKDIVEKYAYRLPGVTDVIDNLEVKLTRDFSDQEIAIDIKNAFRRNAVINAEQIGIQIDNGVVTLSGIVPDYTAKISARDLAYFTAGVTNIIDNIIVRQD